MKYAIWLFFFCFLVLTLSTCGPGSPQLPSDIPENAKCEYDWEANQDVLNHSEGSSTIKEELSQLFSMVESTYLSDWGWFIDTLITNISPLQIIYEGHYYITNDGQLLLQFAKDHKNSDVDFHVLSLGSLPYIGNLYLPNQIDVGGSSIYTLNPPDRYSYIFYGDFIEWNQTNEVRFNTMRHGLAHELGHQLANLTHPTEFQSNHYGDPQRCVMDGLPDYGGSNPHMKYCDSSEDPDPSRKSCSKFLREELDN